MLRVVIIKNYQLPQMSSTTQFLENLTKLKDINNNNNNIY